MVHEFACSAECTVQTDQSGVCARTSGGAHTYGQWCEHGTHVLAMQRCQPATGDREGLHCKGNKHAVTQAHMAREFVHKSIGICSRKSRVQTLLKRFVTSDFTCNLTAYDERSVEKPNERKI